MKRFFSLIFAGLIGGVLVLGGNYFLNRNNENNTDNNVVQHVSNVNVGAGEAIAPLDFTEAAEKSTKSVVHIKSTKKRNVAQRRSNDPFQLFFGNDFWYGGEPQPIQGTGSGVIYTSDGYIVTNNHVIDFADEFEVTLYDKRKYSAKLVGTYPKTDLAVLKIDAQNMPVLNLADSDLAKIGEWVLAVGNPFELKSTVTAGIISAKGRDINIIQGSDAIESFIQTDAVVNPGNSGGALVDSQGRLLGINTAISTHTGVFEGYSFAIPVNIVSNIVDDIIKYGTYQRPYMGISIFELDAEYAEEYGLNISQGVVVDEIAAGGSAQFAGIQPMDIIVGVNGHEINSVPELQELIGAANVGETLNVTVFRKKKRKDIQVVLKAG